MNSMIKSPNYYSGRFVLKQFRANRFLSAGLIFGLSMLISGTLFFSIPPELSKLQERFFEGEVFYAEMTHIITDAYTSDAHITEGTLWISKTKYKIISDDQWVLVDGEASYVYNKHQNKLLIGHYEPLEDDFAPSRFFTGSETPFHTKKTERKGGRVTIHLEPHDPFEIFTSVTILLDEELTPLKISAIDQMENHLETTFQNPHFLAGSDTLFVIQHPENAEVIDLRK